MKQFTDIKLKYSKTLFNDIFIESKNQITKCGVQTHSLFEWQNYLTEELGELAKAIAENEYRNSDAEEIYKEAIQVATLSLKIAEMVLYKK